jgi:hypothetical protein
MRLLTYLAIFCLPVTNFFKIVLNIRRFPLLLPRYVNHLLALHRYRPYLTCGEVTLRPLTASIAPSATPNTLPNCIFHATSCFPNLKLKSRVVKYLQHLARRQPQNRLQHRHLSYSQSLQRILH